MCEKVFLEIHTIIQKCSFYGWYSRAKMSKLILGVSQMEVKEFRLVILIKEIDISHFMVHSQQI